MPKQKKDEEILLALLQKEGIFRDENSANLVKEIFKDMRVKELLDLYSRHIKF